MKAPGTRAFFFFFLRKREGSYTAGPQSLTSMSRTPKTLCKPKAVSQTQCLPWREATNEQSPRTPFGMNAPTLAIERPCFGFGHTPAAESHNMPAARWIPLLKSREEKKNLHSKKHPAPKILWTGVIKSLTSEGPGT